MAFWDKFTDWLGFEWVRARDEKGSNPSSSATI